MDRPELAETPARLSRPAAALVVGAVALQALGLFGWVDGVWFVIALAALLAAALRLGEPRAVHVPLFCLLLAGWARLWPQSGWPLYLLAPLAAYGAIVRLVPRLRATCGWVRLGRPDGRTWWLVVATIPIASAALVVWYQLTTPDVEAFASQIAVKNLVALMALAAAFSVLNAIMEEAAWRGLLTEGLEAAVGPTAALLLQALSFGCAHLHGFPSGAAGVAMATTWAVVLGVQRRWSRGLAAPIVAHVFADVTVFLLLLSFFHRL